MTSIDTQFLSKRFVAEHAGQNSDEMKQASKKEERQKAENEKLKTACQDFESLLINQMFEAMRKTLPGDSIFGDSLGRSIYESMYYQELSTKISRGDSRLGIADQLYRQLTPNTAPNNPQNPDKDNA